MKKLIELLNKFSEEKHTVNYGVVNYNDELGGFDVMLDGSVEFLPGETVTCKRFAFIDWLIENGYIDKSKIKNQYLDMDNEAYENSLLMWLSVEEFPIPVLVEYLKEDETI